LRAKAASAVQQCLAILTQPAGAPRWQLRGMPDL